MVSTRTSVFAEHIPENSESQNRCGIDFSEHPCGLATPVKLMRGALLRDLRVQGWGGEARDLIEYEGNAQVLASSSSSSSLLFHSRPRVE